MLSGLNSNWWSSAAYAITAALAVRTGMSERRRLDAGSDLDLLPVFWYATAAAFGSLAFAHVFEHADLVGAFGRRSARTEGWYTSRRIVQLFAVGGLAAVWMALTSGVVLRLAHRRHRYLPMSLLMAGLAFFLALRLVSLHGIDTALYRTGVAGASVGVVVELTIVAAAAVVAVAQWCSPARPASSTRAPTP